MKTEQRDNCRIHYGARRLANGKFAPELKVDVRLDGFIEEHAHLVPEESEFATVDEAVATALAVGRMWVYDGYWHWHVGVPVSVRFS